jgi:hypothetical protein
MSSQFTDAPAALPAEDQQSVKTASLKEISPPKPTHDPHDAAIVAAQAATTIEADDGPVEDDAYESSSLRSSSSTSLSSSVRDDAFENGRRYHKYREGAYVFPNDDAEQDRENMKHALVLHLSGGKLHFAPIEKNHQNIIDLGTGTGIWAIDRRPPALLSETRAFISASKIC